MGTGMQICSKLAPQLLNDTESQAKQPKLVKLHSNWGKVESPFACKLVWTRKQVDIIQDLMVTLEIRVVERWFKMTYSGGWSSSSPACVALLQSGMTQGVEQQTRLAFRRNSVPGWVIHFKQKDCKSSKDVGEGLTVFKNLYVICRHGRCATLFSL